MNAKDYLTISKELENVQGYYISSEEFKSAFNSLNNIELKSFLYHYIIDNAPYAFNEFINKPLLFEQIKQYIADILNINIEDIKLIGSAKTGFSISPNTYGRKFSTNSDLDFSIINKDIFTNLVNDFNKWRTEYHCKNINPQTDREQKFWDENTTILPENINNGFLDTYKLPNLGICPTTRKINNILYLIKKYLCDYHNIKTKGVSARIYKDEISFYGQLFVNLKNVMKKL